ncbi:LPS export ABC transporter periplasmic protein LptC [Candidatus Omnitrophota bacterium]
MKKKIVLALVFFFISGVMTLEADEAEQMFEGFRISGVSSNGSKTWEVTGETADILTDIVKLTKIVANVYGEEEVTLSAKEGHLNKETGNLLLQHDVVATTPEGARMTTDTLTWDRDSNIVTTDDFVTVQKGEMTATGTGLQAQTELNQATMKKDVTVEFTSEDSKTKASRKTIVTCDGPMEIDYQNQAAEFKNNVLVSDEQGTMAADYMKLLIDFETKEMDKIIARGNVEIHRGENTSHSQEAVYTAADKKVVLSGRPKLVFYTEGEFK